VQTARAGAGLDAASWKVFTAWLGVFAVVVMIVSMNDGGLPKGIGCRERARRSAADGRRRHFVAAMAEELSHALSTVVA
jgi:hypothetical protein